MHRQAHVLLGRAAKGVCFLKTGWRATQSGAPLHIYLRICVYLHLHIHLYNAPLYISIYIYVYVYICIYIYTPID